MGLGTIAGERPASTLNPKMSLFRKVLTRPIWWWERHRRYRIRARCRELPPIHVASRQRKLAILATPDSFLDALWSAWSWYRFLEPEFELVLFCDGDASALHLDFARRLFPGVKVQNLQDMAMKMRGCTPGIAPFLDNHPLAKKLALVLTLQKSGAVLYSDSDVLAFSSPDEISTRLESNHPLYIQEEHHGVFDPAILARAAQLGLSHAPALNSGLLYLPSGSLSVDLASNLLAGWEPPMNSWFTEQTVLSVLLQQAGGSPLPRERYVVSNRRQFYWEHDVDYSKIAVRHFTGPVRHLMYLKGMKLLSENFSENRRSRKATSAKNI